MAVRESGELAEQPPSEWYICDGVPFRKEDLRKILADAPMVSVDGQRGVFVDVDVRVNGRMMPPRVFVPELLCMAVTR